MCNADLDEDPSNLAACDDRVYGVPGSSDPDAGHLIPQLPAGG